jgi:bifunctional oligoribonuclease and PAP phosphatase NrnA
MLHFSEPSSEFVKSFFELTDSAKSIVITSHTSPDDDSTASVLSIRYLLLKKYPEKRVRVIYGGEGPDRYSSFEGYDNIEFVPEIVDKLEDADLIIMLDGGQFSRFSKKSELLKEFKGKTVCIDHHSSPIDNFTLSLVKPKASSTSELIYYCFYQADILDVKSAELLMLGLLGDTGDFTYLRPDESYVFDMAKRLLEVGNFEIQEFKSRYNTISPRNMEILKEYFRNTQKGEISGWPHYSYSTISRKFMEEGKYSDIELKGAGLIYIGAFLRTIKGHPWGFVITPRDIGTCEVSFRSLPRSVNVREVSERMQIGGGHDRAAGGTFKPTGDKKLDVQECLEKLEDWMKNNKPVLS